MLQNKLVRRKHVRQSGHGNACRRACKMGTLFPCCIIKLSSCQTETYVNSLISTVHSQTLMNIATPCQVVFKGILNPYNADKIRILEQTKPSLSRVLIKI